MMEENIQVPSKRTGSIVSKILFSAGLILLIAGIVLGSLCYYVQHAMARPGMTFIPPTVNPQPGKDSFKVAFFSDNGMWPLPLRSVAKEIGKRNADFALCLGDFVHPARLETLWFVSREFMDHFRIPVYATPGNHDVYDMEDQNAFSSVFGRRDQCFAYGDTLFILLESAKCALSKDQLTWLDFVLRTERPKYRRCIIATHVPPVTNALFDRRKFRLDEADAAELQKITDAGKVDLIVCGHVHYAMEVPFGKTTVVVLPTSGQSSRNQENPSFGFVMMDFKKDGSIGREVIYCEKDRDKSRFVMLFVKRLNEHAIAFSVALAMMILGTAGIVVSRKSK